MEGQIKAADRPVYERCMTILRALSEHAAPELFRWLGWSVATAAIQVVAIKTDSALLQVVTWVLFAAIAMRIQWHLNRPAKETETPDGGLTFRVNPWLAFAASILAWGLAWVVAFQIPAQIAASDLLPELAKTEAATPLRR